MKNEIKEIKKEVAPLLSKLSDDINLNENLFARVKTVYDKRTKLSLNGEQLKTLEVYYLGFVRGGANLDDDKKNDLSMI